jgi:endoglucanase
MRNVIAFMAVVAVAAGVFFVSRPQTNLRSWEIYKQRFVTADGRVIDTGNGNVSHTEGQSYAMVLATAYNDRATFDRVWKWTRDTLRRPDGLFSWRYMPGTNDPIADRNNATDGDVMICWGLLRGAAKWHDSALRDEALTLAAALAKAVIVRDGSDAFLLPGAEGFTGPDKRVVNLSYWVFPALADIAKASADPVWPQVIITGKRLIADARFGTHQLPPDWLETSGQLRPAEGYPPRFGYDAVRVPLYLIWANMPDPAQIGAIADYWREASKSGQPPAWIDLVSDAVSPEKQSPGMTAVTQLTLGAVGDHVDARRSMDTGDYYSSSLMMLVNLAKAHGER